MMQLQIIVCGRHLLAGYECIFSIYICSRLCSDFIHFSRGHPSPLASLNQYLNIPTTTTKCDTVTLLLFTSASQNQKLHHVEELTAAPRQITLGSQQFIRLQLSLKLVFMTQPSMASKSCVGGILISFARNAITPAPGNSAHVGQTPSV